LFIFEDFYNEKGESDTEGMMMILLYFHTSSFSFMTHVNIGSQFKTI